MRGWVLVLVLAACGGGRGGGDGDDPDLVETAVEECSSDSVRAMLECEGTGIAFAGCVGIGEACDRLIRDGIAPACIDEAQPDAGWYEECVELARVAAALMDCSTSPTDLWPADPATYTCDDGAAH